MEIGAPRTVWRLPDSLLWLPTAVNAFLAVEIVHLWWQRRQGGYNTAQGDLEIAMHIAAASVPISALLMVGALVILLTRKVVGRSPSAARWTGSSALLAVNVVAPVVLYYGLRWLA